MSLWPSGVHTGTSEQMGKTVTVTGSPGRHSLASLKKDMLFVWFVFVVVVVCLK